MPSSRPEVFRVSFPLLLCGKDESRGRNQKSWPRSDLELKKNVKSLKIGNSKKMERYKKQQKLTRFVQSRIFKTEKGF